MAADEKKEEKPTEPAVSNEATPPPATPETSGALDGKEEVVDATSIGGTTMPDKDPQRAGLEADKPTKKPNVLKELLKKFGVYILIILLLAVVGVAYIIIKGVSNKSAPKTPAVANQTLTQSELKQLTNSNTPVGNANQTLNVQGNTDLSGNVIVKGNLNVAGTIQSGSQFTLAQIKVSGTSSFGSAQFSNLQVATSATFQGVASFSAGMNIAGTSSFTGPITAASFTPTDINLSSNGDIQGHIAFANPTQTAIPGRQVSYGVLGNGGSGSVGGTDTSGTVSINTGNNPQPGCFATIIFSVPYNNTPNVLIGPINLGAGESNYYTIVTKTSFKICTSTASPKNQAFAFDYFVGATPS